MPRLSDSMEEGTILKWLKGDGDEVSRGDELVEIETDKANMTYEADSDGTLQIVAKEGDTLPVGEVIARLGDGAAPSGDGAGAERAEGEGDDEPEADDDSEPDGQDAEAEPERQREERQAPVAEKEPDAQERPAPSANGAADGDGRVKASPVARRMAREMGLELQGLSGSGPGGRIVKADVEAASREGGASAPAPAEEEAAPERERRAPAAPVADGGGGKAKGEVSVQDLSRAQQVVARRMAESKATAPDFQLHVDVDMEEAVGLRERLKEAAGDGVFPSLNDFVVKASALALREHPRANGAYRDGRFELYSRVNVGIAVAANDALVVPTIFDADAKSLGRIAAEARDLAERVREGAITPPEVSGGTFTVSNLGMYGITSFSAVINPPQAAILSVGAVEPRPVARDGFVVVRQAMTMTLACDHRILYGAPAAEFLARVRELLEQPLALAL